MSATCPSDPNDILLTEWAARDLQVAPGDRVSLEYYLWTDGGQLVTRSADFRLAGIVPTGAGSRDLVPTFPGMSGPDLAIAQACAKLLTP